MVRQLRTRVRGAVVLSAFLGWCGALGCAADDPTAPDGPGNPPPPPPPGSEVVQLEWDAPTANSDGSQPLTDLLGYTVCYGQSSNDIDTCIDTGGGTSYDLTLPNGTYYFVVRAYDRWRNESDPSNVLTVVVGGSSATADAQLIAGASPAAARSSASVASVRLTGAGD